MVSDEDVTLIIQASFDIRTELRRITAILEAGMARKETKRKIREEVRADQARYDEVTRRLKERIERGPKAESQISERRESS